jgi:hypothetical protein
VLDQKRRALACHRSQTVRLVDDPGWLVLGDVAGGTYLDNLLADHEWFHVPTP